MNAAEILEILRVVCFGFSWPMNVIKSYHARTTKGKSLGFLLMICIGYVLCKAMHHTSGSFGSVLRKQVSIHSGRGLRIGCGGCFTTEQKSKDYAKQHATQLLNLFHRTLSFLTSWAKIMGCPHFVLESWLLFHPV